MPSSVSQNQNTLHTADGCVLQTPMAGTGKVLTTNCYALQNYNIGCGVGDTRATSFGPALNKVGGGAWAMTFNSTGPSIP